MTDELPLPRRFRVGVRLPEWSTGFSFRIFAGLTDFQRQSAPFQLFFNQPSGGDLPATIIDESWDGDGLIVFRYTAEEARAWKERGVAVVNLSAETPEGGPVFPRVTLDNRKIGAMAVEHLAALGLRDFCYIHESTRSYSEARWKGFEAAVKAIGGRSHRIDIPVSSFPEDIRVRRIRETMRGPILKLPRPCGIFTKDDIAAVWTLKMLSELGIRCPEEMPVLGVDDDIVFCHTTQPPLSSISYPGRHIGFEAAKLLHRMLTSEVRRSEDHLEIPPTGLVSRESTRHVILKDPVVTKALAVIRREVPRTNIQVAEVARLCGVSRELLRQRFQEQLDQSPKDEIKRLRLRHLMEILTTTDWTLEAIAENCGYSGAEEICRFIKRNTGKTTGEIRRGGN
ncbi:MAG: XylR family transcriptional regulator [Luteolibacter sp.]